MTTMQTTIEFSPENINTNETETPWITPKGRSYEDIVLKPEYQARRLKFESGQTWVRIVPAFKESIHNWMLPIHVLNFNNGRLTHPKTLTQKAKNAFDHAYTWALKNRPEILFSKLNKSGARLLTDPMGAFWVLLEEAGKPVVRLFLGSAYNGSRGGNPGLAYQIWKMSRERDESGDLITDLVNPTGGVLVCIEKTQAKGSRYPTYSLRAGRQQAPMNSMLERMDASEISALCPLENVLRSLSVDEEWQYLERILVPEVVKEIREDLAK